MEEDRYPTVTDITPDMHEQKSRYDKNKDDDI